MKNTLLVLICLMSFAVYGQTNQQKASELGRKAILEMEAGNFDKSVDLLKDASKLDPDNIDYPYEMAYARYLEKDFKSAIKILKKLTNHDQVNDLIYQMLGNSYDVNGDTEMAIKTYEEGMEKFPNSGRLYLERGNIELIRKEYIAALELYEQGIKVDPAYPSNYYWASKIYMGSSEEVWGMIYGEIFMNLERNTRRTAEISELMYNTYKSEITFETDTSMSVSFCQNMALSIDNLSEGKELTLPFGMIYETTLLTVVPFAGNSIDLVSLDKIRTGFVDMYFQVGHNQTHPNILFDYQKEVLDAGHFEAYNFWLLRRGDGDAFDQWRDANEDKWKNFVDWFNENGLEVDKNHCFHSSQY